MNKVPQLVQFEAATGVPKTYLALGAGSFFFLMIFFNFAGQLFSNLLGFVYPAYRSFKALETPEKEDDKQWLTYWYVLFSLRNWSLLSCRVVSCAALLFLFV